MVLGSFARILRLITAYFPYFNIYFALLSRHMPCLWQPFGNTFRKSREILWQLSYLRGYFYKYNRRNVSYCRFIPPSCAACVVCITCVICVAFVSLLAFVDFLDFLPCFIYSSLLFLAFCSFYTVFGALLPLFQYFFLDFALFLPCFCLVLFIFMDIYAAKGDIEPKIKRSKINKRRI